MHLRGALIWCPAMVMVQLTNFLAYVRMKNIQIKSARFLHATTTRNPSTHSLEYDHLGRAA